MKKLRRDAASLTLRAATAAELMTPNPVSIGAGVSVKEAAAFLTEKGFSAAPVIDKAGRAIGVLSRSDIVVHDREKVDYLALAPDYYDKAELTTAAGERLPNEFQVENVDSTCVKDIMTPVVYAVAPHDPSWKVIEEMASRKVHRLFVVDGNGTLVGVISVLDVVRHLSREFFARASEIAPVA
jgi:CBS domain-containing protein